jgi:O-antigen/teichoic acid export membrane protein
VRTASVLGGPFAAVLVTCSLGTLWLAGLRLGLTAIVWLTVVCIVVSTIVPAVLLWRRVMALPAGGDPTQTVEARELLHIGGPLLVTSLVLIAGSQGDLWVVAALRPDADVAVYGVAVRTATLVGFPLFVTTAVLAPVIAQMYARGQVRSLERLLRLSATVATVPALLLFTLFFLVGSPLLGVTYGDFYRRGAVVLALLSAGQLASVGAGVCGLLLSVTGHQRLLMTVTAVVGVFTMVSVVVLTHAHGIVGAATAACLGLVGQNVGMVIAARRTTGIRTQVSAAALRRWWGERHSDESLPGTSDRQASA